MPELPDLLYIKSKLDAGVAGRTITAVTVKQPVILRSLTGDSLERILPGKRIEGIALHGPFLRFLLDAELELAINLMLAGRLQHQKPGEHAEGHLCLSLELDDGSRINFCDSELMAKVYLTARCNHQKIPRLNAQGIDVLSPAFTPDAFVVLAAQHRRKQVRVFINDHSILSAIGNAYADEILFEARIHPKTLVAYLEKVDLLRLHGSILSVLRWGIEEVARAAQPIQVKVRNHMKVRNRKGDPCPRCGTIIRREGVRGHDVFFCPSCQPPTRKHFIDWSKLNSAC